MFLLRFGKEALIIILDNCDFPTLINLKLALRFRKNVNDIIDDLINKRANRWVEREFKNLVHLIESEKVNSSKHIQLITTPDPMDPISNRVNLMGYFYRLDELYSKFINHYGKLNCSFATLRKCVLAKNKKFRPKFICHYLRLGIINYPDLNTKYYMKIFMEYLKLISTQDLEYIMLTINQCLEDTEFHQIVWFYINDEIETRKIILNKN